VRKNSLVMRRCISCRVVQDRLKLLKFTNDINLGLMINKGIGRSAYVCKTAKCSKHSKFKKNLQKSLKTTINPKFYEIIEMEIQNYK
tara:strand:- start:123 stop:383 length:261 start_codon:yes stop_codon:yes gene_type:complete